MACGELVESMMIALKSMRPLSKVILCAKYCSSACVFVLERVGSCLPSALYQNIICFLH